VLRKDEVAVLLRRFLVVGIVSIFVAVGLITLVPPKLPGDPDLRFAHLRNTVYYRDFGGSLVYGQLRTVHAPFVDVDHKVSSACLRVGMQREPFGVYGCCQYANPIGGRRIGEVIHPIDGVDIVYTRKVSGIEVPYAALRSFLGW